MDPRILHSIDEELTKTEVAALKFLCLDLIGRKRLENVKDAKDLFLRLTERAMLDDEHYLAELLHTIGRYDLLVLLGTNKRDVSSWLHTRTDSRLGLSPYRKMLYKLSEDVTAENLRAIKFLLDELPRAKLQDSATFLDVLAEMEKIQLLAEDKLDVLMNVLDRCDKQLANQVREFQNLLRMREQDYSSEPMYPSHPKQEQSMEIPYSPLSIAETSPEVPGRQPVEPDANVPTTPIEVEDFYSLKRRPRGYCLIINNYDFTKSHTSSSNNSYKNRTGTDKDAFELIRVFTRLHFLTEEKNDLCASEMLDVIKEFAGKDHSQMDAFVCCILSHGLKGTVLGADGQTVKIRELTQAFALCRSLLNKPKLFFIQACQGVQLQRPVYIQADGKEESNEEEEKELEDDAQSVTLLSIPIEADFLIGMATVESYKSFRHTHKGSIFIQELCRQIESGLQRKEDILSIMTRVNREVSTQVLNGFKQMPEPRYTLTKKLVFTLD
ncbi:caspase-8 [Salminus brasiliensis]|uniref:caspase-8 n=1 Tax=Salminus brasiliensis TaxID=930266 RepID=UPI003B83842B